MVPPRLPRCATCGLDSGRRGRGSGEPVHADHGPDLRDALLTRSSIRSRPQSLLAKPYLLPKYGGGEARSTADSPVAEGGIAGAPSSTPPRRSSNQRWMAALVHEEPFKGACMNSRAESAVSGRVASFILPLNALHSAMRPETGHCCRDRPGADVHQLILPSSSDRLLAGQIRKQEPG